MFKGFQALVCCDLTQPQGLKIDPVCKRGAAHFIGALDPDTVISGMLQSREGAGKGTDRDNFSEKLLTVLWLRHLLQKDDKAVT